MSKRIALSFPGCHRRGGIERVMLECANFLAARGHETHVYASDWDHAGLNPAILSHQVPALLRPRMARLLTYAIRCRRDMAAITPPADVHGAFSVVSPPGGVLWVPSVHRAWLEISRQQRGARALLRQKLNLSHPVTLAFERACFQPRRHKRLIALSAQVKADVMRYYGVPESDIVILPNGFSPTEFNVSVRTTKRAEMRARLGYAVSDRVVIFVANELERKGFAPLLRALAALSDSSVHLLAVGRLNPTTYAAEIARLGMMDRVQWTGPTNTVADYYAAADVFALPTQYEAWGLVIVEAMACGLPVLTSRLAGASITVRTPGCGALLEDPRHREEIVDKLRPLIAGQHHAPEEIADSVAEYAWDRVLLGYEKILLEASAAKGSS